LLLSAARHHFFNDISPKVRTPAPRACRLPYHTGIAVPRHHLPHRCACYNGAQLLCLRGRLALLGCVDRPLPARLFTPPTAPRLADILSSTERATMRVRATPAGRNATHAASDVFCTAQLAFGRGLTAGTSGSGISARRSVRAALHFFVARTPMAVYF